MKRPSLALLALLASLAFGLAVISPRRADATTLGELLCAIEVIAPPCHTADSEYVPACPYADECPHICTPPGMPCPQEAYDEVEAAEPAAEVVDATAQVELNAADVSSEPDSGTSWEDEYGNYYGDFMPEEESTYGSEYASEYEATPAEVEVENVAEPEVVEELAAELPDFCYGNYDPWSVVDDTTTDPSPEDLVVEAGDATTVDEMAPCDLYGREPGDQYYGHDYDVASPEVCEYDNAYEYEYDYDYSNVEEATPVVEETEPVAAATPEASAESYYEEYYPDYYAELYSGETNEAESTDTVEEAAIEDLTTEYDAAYDNAVYGTEDEAASTETLPAPGTAIEVPNDEILDELVDPTPTADAEADLPWADEAPVTEEVTQRPALESEYGSDYAEDYYRALFGDEVEESTDELDEEEVDTAEPLLDETYDYFQSPCRETECLHPKTIDATQLVVTCGRAIVDLTESLEIVSMRLHSACVQLAELPSHIETK